MRSKNLLVKDFSTGVVLDIFKVLKVNEEYLTPGTTLVMTFWTQL